MKKHIFILSAFLFFSIMTRGQIRVIDVSLKPLVNVESRSRSEQIAENTRPKMEHKGFIVQLQLSAKNFPCKGKLFIKIGVEKDATEFLNEIFDIKCDSEYGRDLIHLYNERDTVSKRASVLNEFLSLTSVASSKEKGMAKWLTLYSINESGRESEKIFYQIK